MKDSAVRVQQIHDHARDLGAECAGNDIVRNAGRTQGASTVPEDAPAAEAVAPSSPTPGETAAMTMGERLA